MIRVAAKAASASDLDSIEALYTELEAEMAALKEIWPATDGLPAPIDRSLHRLIESSGDQGLIVGEIDDQPMGFLAWHHARLLPQGGDRRIAAIDLIFTDPAARRVGVGEAMLGLFLQDAAAAGITLFDATAPPGHRDAKNFFESHGFKARRIVMHRDTP